MKKTWIKQLISFFAAVCCVMMLFQNVQAESSFQYVIDDAGVLSQQQLEDLNQIARDLTATYECAVHIVTVDDSDITMDTIQFFSESLYLSSDQFGYGTDKDGFMLVVSVSERCYWLLAYGDFGNYALTDYGKDVMSEQFVDDFKYDDWYQGFKDYLSFSETVLSMAMEKEPFDMSEEKSMNPLTSYGIGAFVALIVSFILCESWKSQMQTAVYATDAHDYLSRFGANIHFRNDRFAYRTTTRSKIESSSSSKGGTTVNKKGFSGKGGKF